MARVAGWQIYWYVNGPSGTVMFVQTLKGGRAALRFVARVMRQRGQCKVAGLFLAFQRGQCVWLSMRT